MRPSTEADCRCGNFSEETVDAEIEAAIATEREACIRDIDQAFEEDQDISAQEIIRAKGKK